MESREILEDVIAAGAILRYDHFILSSKRHSDTYFNKHEILSRPDLLQKLCGEMARRFVRMNVDVVIGPATGAIPLVWQVALLLSYMKSKEIRACYAEKASGGRFIIVRGFEHLIARKHVLVVEDVITTGSSVGNVISAVRKLGGEVVGVSALCVRGDIEWKAGDQRLANAAVKNALVTIDAEDWNKSKCPLCRRRVPINQTLGHGKEFVASECV